MRGLINEVFFGGVLLAMSCNMYVQDGIWNCAAMGRVSSDLVLPPYPGGRIMNESR